MSEYREITSEEALKRILSDEYVEFYFGHEWRKLTRDYNIGMLSCKLRIPLSVLKE